MKSTRLLLGCALTIALTGAGKPTAAAPNLHELMKDVAAQAQIIWDIGNRTMDADGNPDPAKVAEADWRQVLSASGKVRDAAKTLAEAKHIVGAAAGQKIQGEENPGSFGARQVEQAIAANPQAFSAFARQLAASMDEIAQAARRHEAAKAFEVAGQLDQVCEQCHLVFWYPEEKTAL